MEKLKSIIEKYERWESLKVYISRIESYRDTDLSICLENSKSLIESIAKEICKTKGMEYLDVDSTGKLIKKAFESLGFTTSSTVTQIGGALAHIGAHMGELRNKIGNIAHGKTLEELKECKELINNSISDFLINSSELVSIFLIQLFEGGLIKESEIGEFIDYEDNTEFNEYWDEIYSEHIMSDYSFPSSLILYKLDPLAYKNELENFKLISNETDI